MKYPSQHNSIGLAHLRSAMAEAPGKRALLVIGAGHKPWLDQILSASLDSRIVHYPDHIGDPETPSE